MVTQNSDQNECVLIILVLDLGYLVSQEHLTFAKSNSSPTHCPPALATIWEKEIWGAPFLPRPPGEKLSIWLSWELTRESVEDPNAEVGLSLGRMWGPPRRALWRLNLAASWKPLRIMAEHLDRGRRAAG